MPWPEEEEDRPEWEIEAEEEKEGRTTLDRISPTAKVIFLALIGLVVLGGLVLLIERIGEEFFGG
ncbi:MAG: hypothetical protein EA425_08500 [Puniceicoccaceae bacterium]|nr:MAG: hypothetical protein EA425_08500 [Puniceicoccaceae bacterium]